MSKFTAEKYCCLLVGMFLKMFSDATEQDEWDLLIWLYLKFLLDILECQDYLEFFENWLFVLGLLSEKTGQ